MLIPEEAKRSSATTNKCRCEFAKVLEIQNEKNGIYEKSEKTEIVNYNNLRLPYTKYKIGEYVYPDSFDDNRFNECSHGIHFFINKEEAINYKV